MASETVADICKRARKELDKSWWEIDREFVRDLPTKMLTAHDREVAPLRKVLEHTLGFIKQCEKADTLIALKQIQDPDATLKLIEEARDELKDHIRVALGEKGGNDGE